MRTTILILALGWLCTTAGRGWLGSTLISLGAAMLPDCECDDEWCEDCERELMEAVAAQNGRSPV